MSATNVRVVNNATMARSTVALDTAALLIELNAKRAAMRLGGPKFVAERRQFAPSSYGFEDGRVHVWLLRVSLFDGEALGGFRPSSRAHTRCQRRLKLHTSADRNCTNGRDERTSLDRVG